MRMLAGLVLITLSFTVTAAEVAWVFQEGFDGRVADQRKQAADTLLAQVTSVRKAIPEPATEDREWIAGELAYLKDNRDAGDYQVRFGNLYNSPRFQSVQLHDHLVAISRSLECAAAGGNDAGNEMSCWNRAAYLLLDTLLMINALRLLASREYIQPQQFHPAMDAVPVLFAANGRGIIDLVVGRYLEGR